MPAVILGDFNADLTDGRNCTLQFMNSHGFSQLVNQPTADNGTLIDHIYITSLNTI